MAKNSVLVISTCMGLTKQFEGNEASFSVILMDLLCLGITQMQDLVFFTDGRRNDCFATCYACVHRVVANWRHAYRHPTFVCLVDIHLNVHLFVYLFVSSTCARKPHTSIFRYCARSPSLYSVSCVHTCTSLASWTAISQVLFLQFLP